ncbi:Type 1 glutamine amidotransferase-like domain-containing protein [Paracraurococcus lichenis]|uniref:Type 1 glutamine amidotransferase-like domain-containing protein n=1 Tax=Paracraurococcus lichenis TaxID=3064888 RepID=A0ABT9EAP2_9PROT|nr:Type 1 glutamine amidotransferase-like domain-containing protein [Paracraurococcus sp. LOR1-02]MDO9713221.1 Type 1 glutamine amidotransferase-like domain-containing protein [Paracraurococcus sp. LOR1-02]
MRLILAGGGDATRSSKVDSFYRSLNPGRRTIACIPHAIAPAEGAWEGAERWLLERPALKGFAAHTIGDLAGAEPATLSSFHSLFVMGGNTFTLLACVKAAGFGSKLRAVLDEVPIYGTSAGAIILGHDIESAQVGPEPDENTAGLLDLGAFDLLGGYNAYTHFAPEQSRLLADFCRRANRPCIALSEAAGVFVEDQEITSIGADPVVIAYPSGASVRLEEGHTIRLLAFTEDA